MVDRININDRLKNLPKIDEILKDPTIGHLLDTTAREVVVSAIRESIEEFRGMLKNAEEIHVDNESVVLAVTERLHASDRKNLRRVINGTGIVLHTNLGRAKLAGAAAENVVQIAKGYSTLEYDIKTGERGSRHDHVSDLIARVTGAQAAMVVNNNAAATLLCLVALANNKEVVVSRGELVEIGGAFRVPEIMETGGTILKEVGTTNKTRLADYEKAISPATGALLKVHTSNYRIVGFTEETSVPELALLASKHNIPMIYDLGSGLLVDLHTFGLDEPTVGKALSEGADVVLFSGDKLLGGPQAGIIVGKQQYIDIMKKNALARVVRVDKMTLAGLEETFRIYRDKKQAMSEIPVLSMITRPIKEIRKKAEALAAELSDQCIAVDFFVVDEIGRIGGGSAPTMDLKTVAVAVQPWSMHITDLEKRLREHESPIIARIAGGKLLLDMRTISDDEIPSVKKVFLDIFA
jgi:L-seryl-tRNA(Ser) seleniumtransferase